MDELPKMALIATRPGPVRNSLISLMRTLPAIDLVAESKDKDSMLRLSSQIEPDLVIMEADSPGSGIAETLRAVRASWPASRIMVLVEDHEQEQTARQMGADVVLFSGCRAPRLMVHMEELLGCPARRSDEAVIGSVGAL